MHDSFTPVGGLVPLFNIQLGEIIFGGVGAGLYGMLIFVLLAVFIAGLMVGRTPEYLGKKVQAFEVKMSGLVVLVLTLSILVFSAWAAGANNFGAPDPVTNALTNGTNNNGPGSFPMDGWTFIILLIGTVLLIGALNFLPALALGPVVEHFLMHAGKLF